MDPISKVKVSGTSYEVKDETARLAIVTLNNTKLDVLVSGDNIKTINGESILGYGDITVAGSSPTRYAVKDYDGRNGGEGDINDGLPEGIVNLDYFLYTPYMEVAGTMSGYPSVNDSVIMGVYLVVATDSVIYDSNEETNNPIIDICLLEVTTTNYSLSYIPNMHSITLDCTEYLLFSKKKRVCESSSDSVEMNPTIFLDYTESQWVDYDYFGTNSGGGSGDVTGPSSSTDNAIVRFDGATGKTIQNSGITIDDSNNVESPGSIYLTNIGSTIAASTSRLYLGPASSPYLFLSGNSSGMFGLYNVSGNGFGFYPTLCIFATNNIDIGRTNNLWKDLYMSGQIKSSTGNLAIPSKTGTIAVTSDIPTGITIHTGTSTPSSSLGNNGDIYIKTTS